MGSVEIWNDEFPTPNIRWFFQTSCIANCWFDPPTVSGCVRETDGASLFTSVDDFPSGFAADFNVLVGGSSLGFFGPGGETPPVRSRFRSRLKH